MKNRLLNVRAVSRCLVLALSLQVVAGCEMEARLSPWTIR